MQKKGKPTNEFGYSNTTTNFHSANKQRFKQEEFLQKKFNIDNRNKNKEFNDEEIYANTRQYTTTSKIF